MAKVNNGYQSKNFVPDSEGGKDNIGFIALHRKIRDHWIWDDADKLKWWLDILLECNHSGQKVLFGYDTLECNRGQSLHSLEQWAKRWRVDVGKVRRFFELLEREAMIVRENVKKTTRLTVCNYDTYNKPRQSNEFRTNSQQIQNESQTNTNNNDKNVNNENNENKKGGADKKKKIIEINYPWNTESFREKWETWRQYKLEQFNFKYKGTISEQSALTALFEFANGNETIALERINQAISNSWKGLVFKDDRQKNSKNGTRTSKPNAQLQETNAFGSLFNAE